jgi:parallel beta-helix repeat protein
VVDENGSAVAAKTIIVDAAGNGNYTTIQAAIDAANAGDTIRVWAGTYNEEIIIKKSLNLIGNGTKNTTIKGKKSNSVIDIDRTNWVNVTGFSIRDSGSGDLNAGILVWTSDFCCIYNNNVSFNGKFGIFLYYSSNCTIKNNTLLNNNKGVFLLDSDNNIIKNNSCNYNNKGIDIRGKWGNYIKNNTCKSNIEEGIDIQSQSRCFILNNSCISNSGIGISVDGINNTIGNNYCFNNTCGISIRLNNNKIFNNNCTNNSGAGITLSSGYNTIWNNTLLNCGFSLTGNKLEHWNTNSLYANNTVNNKPLYFLKNQTSGKAPLGVPQVILANCSNITIENLTLNNASIGIDIGFSNNITIKNNTCSFNGLSGMGLYHSLNNFIIRNKYNINDIGLELDYSSNNEFINNIFDSNNWEGIKLDYSSNNEFMNNTFDSNSWEGIKLDYSSNNLFINNTLNSNRYGIRIYDSSNDNSFMNNTCNFNNMDGIRFFGRDSNYNILVNNSCSFNDRIGIYLDGDPFDFPPLVFLNTTILNNNCSNNSYGIRSKGGLNTIIKNNTIISNQNYGCYFEETFYNEIAFNLIESNKQHGIYLKSSFNNTLYNNNFNNNNNHANDDGNNIWNLSIPIGGNYWDNWTSPDNNMDGFVDNPLQIPGGNNKDNLPLVIKNSLYYRVHNINKNTSYPMIQAAINAANAGDTIRVWAGNYNENVIINKTVTLIGNGSTNTSIIGDRTDNTVLISADWVNISGFEITNNSISGLLGGIGFSNNNKNCRIESCNFTDKHYGIFLKDTSGNKIINNTFYHIDANEISVGIYVWYSSDNNIIENNNFINCGMKFWGSNGNSFQNNTITNDGIYVSYCYNNIIKNNSIMKGGFAIDGGDISHFTSHGIHLNNTVNGRAVFVLDSQTGGKISIAAGQIYLVNCSHIIVENQNLSYASYGLYLFYSNNNYIRNNTINNNSGNSIYLFHSANNEIKNNTILNNYYGIRSISSSDYNLISNNKINNTYNSGIDIYYSSDNKIENNTCNYTQFGYGIELGTYSYRNILDNNTSNHNFGYGVVFKQYSSSNTIKNSISNYNLGNGLYIIGESLRCVVEKNTFNFNRRSGISLGDSSSHIIKNNNCSENNESGIYIYSNGPSNKIINNTCFSNRLYGINIESSKNLVKNNDLISNLNGLRLVADNNLIQENNILNNEMGINEIDLFNEGSSNVIENNIIAFNTKHGIQNGQYDRISYNDISNNNWSGINLTSANSVIDNNLIMHNQDGITGQNIDETTIKYNTISKNGDGIRLSGNSDVNNIFGNLIYNNSGYAFNFSSSSNGNLIYYNNIINNTNQAIDLGNNTWNNTRQHGNYWSDYIGLDNGNGSRKANDGIGDTLIPHLGLDNYPLMAPWSQPEIVYVDDDFTNASLYWNWTHFNKIQDGIDALKDGGTVYVYEGTYYENVIVNKGVRIIGNGSTNTTIEGYNNGDGLNITKNLVNITGFTINNSSKFGAVGVRLFNVNNCQIRYCNLTNNRNAILLDSSSNNIISNNNFSNNTEWGIYLISSSNNLIENNSMNNNYGIIILVSPDNVLKNNKIQGEERLGIIVEYTTSITLQNNSMNSCGLIMSGATIEHWNSHNIDISNTVNGKPLFYLKNINGSTVPFSVGQAIFVSCSNITMENQNCSNGAMGVQLIDSNNCSIKNNSFNNNYHGIFIYFSSRDNIIENNTCSESNRDGILINVNSDRNTIRNNVIYNNVGDGVDIVNSLNIKILNNTFFNNSRGVRFYQSSNNNLTNNTIINNGGGILFNKVYNSNINYNNITMNRAYGIYLDWSSDNSINHNYVSNNTDYGIRSWLASNNRFVNNTCNGHSDSGIYLYLLGNNFVKDNTCNNNIGYGIKIIQGSYSDIENNTCIDNDIGLWLSVSGESNIINNTFKNCNKGMRLSNSGQSTIINNTCNFNNVYGIKLESTSNCILKNNNCSNNNMHGIFLGSGKKNTLINNFCLNNRDGMYLFSSTDNIIINNHKIINNENGIFLTWDSEKNYISNNSCIKNKYGIFFNDSSSNNIIENNTVVSNEYAGIFLNDSGNNDFSSNDLANNSIGFEFINSIGCNIHNTTEMYSINYDLRLNKSSQVYVINSSINQLKTQYLDPISNLTVQWYLHVNVVNETFAPFPGVNLSIKDNSSKEILFGITDTSGSFKWIRCTQYIENQSGTILINTPHNLTASKRAFEPAYSDLYMNVSRKITLVILNDITPPEAPTNFDIMSIGGHHINLSWKKSSDHDVQGYYIYMNATGTNLTFNLIGSTTKNYFNTTGLIEQTRYYFQIIAFDDVPLLSKPLNGSVSTLDITPPDPPTVLEFSSKGGTFNNLTWNTSTSIDVQGYEIYVNNTGSTMQFHYLANTTSNYYNHTGLAQETIYYYKVRAFDEVPLFSGFSNTVSTRTYDITPPAAPNNLNIIKNGGKYIHMIWTGSVSSDVQGYEIFMNDTGSSSNYHYLTTTTTTFFNHTGLIEETTYYYRVRAFDEVPLLSIFSNSVSVTTLDITKPAAPTNLKAKNPSGHSITLTWDLSSESDLAGYHIYMNDTGKGSLGPFHRIHTIIGSTTQYDVTGLVEITKYHFVIIAFDEVPNNSSVSNVASETTLDVTAPMIITGSENIKTTTGEEFQLFAEFQDNADIDIVNIFYTRSITWQEKTLPYSVTGNYSIKNTDLSIVTSSDITSWKYYFYAEDTSGNNVYYGTQQNPFIITVIDNDKPIADAGEDIGSYTGTNIIFDASNSTDNIEIVEYTWTFEYDNVEVNLFGKEASFQFEIRGTYEITLTVMDAAGYTAFDTIEIEIYLRMVKYIQLIFPHNQSLMVGPKVTLSWESPYPGKDIAMHPA